MPELPEVETTRQGIAPSVVGQRILGVLVRDGRLRWPVAADLDEQLRRQRVHRVERRAKYLLLRCDDGTLILHLGMSGSLRLVPVGTPPRPHEHVDVRLESGLALRLHDPRRFGSLQWTRDPPEQHPLLLALGPEPLGPDFDGAYLHRRSRGRRSSVKALLMDSHTVAGLGNIYANEALYLAGIRPTRAAGRISAPRYARLARAVRTVLTQAIRSGGTTLRDFLASDGSPGYFAQQLQVYGREGQPCLRCGTAIHLLRTGQRATYFCPSCQR